MNIRKFLPLLGLLFLINIAQSQEINKKVKASLKAGLNIANVAGPQSKPHLNFHAGIVMEIPISEKFSLQPELLFSKQGYVANFNDLLVKFSYINLPIMNLVKINNTVAFQFGPQFGS